jgi:hypothetical protein
MRITGNSRLPGTVHTRKKASASSGFELPSEETDAKPAAGGTRFSTPVINIGVVLASSAKLVNSDRLQQTAIGDGKEALKLLDSLQAGILEGRLNRSTISKLKTSLENTPAIQGNAQLQATLDQIKLRVKVELAKLDSSMKA